MHPPVFVGEHSPYRHVEVKNVALYNIGLSSECAPTSICGGTFSLSSRGGEKCGAIKYRAI